MTAIVLALSLLSVDPPRRLAAELDPPGSWRTVKSGTATFLVRILTYSTATIVYRGATVPRQVEIREPGKEKRWINNPLYVLTPALSWVTLELTYDTHPPFLLEREFVQTEDGLPDLVEIKREVERRLATSTLWPPERIQGGLIVLAGGEVLDDRAAPTIDPATVTRVSWRAIVEDNETTADQAMSVRLAAGRVALEAPEELRAAIEAAVVREIVLPRYSKVAGKGWAERTP